MYDLVPSVPAWLRAGARVDLAWTVETRGISSREPGEAVAFTAAGDRAGGLLGGGLDTELTASVAPGRTGRLVDLHLSDDAAARAGLACGGHARCLVVAATDLPAALWERLARREPVCLVSTLDGDEVSGTRLLDAETVADAGDEVARRFRRGTDDTWVTGDAVVTVRWPVPRLVIVGSGAIVDAVVDAAELLGWRTEVADDDGAAALVAPLTRVDKLVVTSHDHDVAGAVLAAALAGEVGYVGALGSRHTQQGRAEWLAERGVIDLDRIHGPAGLDLGSRTPAEIAVAIVAEALMVASGASGTSLRAVRG